MEEFVQVIIVINGLLGIINFFLVHIKKKKNS